MTTTYLSVWLSHLPTDRLKRLGPGLKRNGGRSGDAPAQPGLVTLAKIKGAQRVVSVDAVAAAHAVKSGMTLADARAIHPGLAVADADPRSEAATLDAIGAWCGRFTPLVALDGADGLVLDIGGVAHLFGGPEALVRLLESGLAAQGFTPQAAIAETPEAAWALARFGTVKIAPVSTGKDFAKQMAALPLAALRLEPATIQSLAQAGLRRVGDLVWRPRAPLAARFGNRLFERLDAVMGQLKNPISPRFDPPAFVVEQVFASPIAQREAIEGTLLALSGHLCGLLERHQKGARGLVATLFRVDGVVKRISVGTSRPLDQPDAMARLFRERIESVGEDGLDTGYGFDLVRLAVHEAETLPLQQTDLVPEEEALPDIEDLGDLVDRLGARLGLRRVTRLQTEDRHGPEFAVMAVPAVTVPMMPAGLDRPFAKPTRPNPDPLSRPIRLFARPEPIETIAGIPDGPPVQFKWRRNTHEVTAIEGPERIAPEWWKHDRNDRLAETRDYFRAEDRHGRRFWLFREGLFGSGQQASHKASNDERASDHAPLSPEPSRLPRWYVHGLFG
ncbi:DNA polymerase Y family protein [Lichenihabitans sp. PAMC28606]|uniref:Y-family DNA polymerase n=1 Tax=Lichenihabitans sp. PAMC28606 TaxID=2880932 RepID=UPI001D0AE434|nr:DNA polymerase Y family protein [Lichenihabitans sp. PAMC28606]UDL94840.1 DNA polymerase Y family protein [Lichenihabitans sp. PAMC28606]